MAPPTWSRSEFWRLCAASILSSKSSIERCNSVFAVCSREQPKVGENEPHEAIRARATMKDETTGPRFTWCLSSASSEVSCPDAFFLMPYISLGPRRGRVEHTKRDLSTMCVCTPRLASTSSSYTIMSGSRVVAPGLVAAPS